MPVTLNLLETIVFSILIDVGKGKIPSVGVAPKATKACHTSRAHRHTARRVEGEAQAFGRIVRGALRE